MQQNLLGNATSEYHRRDPMCKPGALVYSAKMDQEKLECLYCMSCLCPVKETLSKRSFLDIYSNGILMNAPSGTMCCCWLDRTMFLLWDDKRFGTFGKAGICQPFPWCCPHYCGCCGEGVYMFRQCACCFSACPTGFGHTYSACFCCLCAMCSTEVMLGLADGEAENVKRHIDIAKGQGAAAAMPATAIVQPGQKA